MERRWFYKGNRELAPMAISLSMATGSLAGKVIESHLDENDEMVIDSECEVCRAGHHDTTYTLYTEDDDHEVSHTEFPSLYQVAKLHSGGFFRVLAQDSASKDDVQHLLLRTPKGDLWYPIEQVSPTL
jgi:hypothetical protein